MKIPTKIDWLLTDKPDCQIRALANATSMSYESSLDLLSRLGWDIHHRGLFVDKAEQLPGLLRPVELPAAKISLAWFIQSHPTGRFICRKPRHVFAVVDGFKIDFIDTNNRINAAWEIITE